MNHLLSFIYYRYLFIKWTKSEQLLLVANAPINSSQLRSYVVNKKRRTRTISAQSVLCKWCRSNLRETNFLLFLLILRLWVRTHSPRMAQYLKKGAYNLYWCLSTMITCRSRIEESFGTLEVSEGGGGGGGHVCAAILFNSVVSAVRLPTTTERWNEML